jgi:Protein of unknown function (DUF2950)
MKQDNSFLNSARSFSGRIRCAVVLWAIAAMGAAQLAHPLFAQSAAPAFSTPAGAAQSLFQAVQSNDTGAIEKVLGGPTDLASCRDGDRDKVDREMFVKKYQEMHRTHREPDGSVTLYIGAENWPFPIPLVEQGGAWHFDPEAGAKEVLFRRIGANELKVIGISHDFVAKAANPDVTALSQGAGSSAVLIDGYYFRVLAPPSRNGGAGKTGKTAATVAVVAYPAEYRVSGIMTFIITGNNGIYEKDLGASTSESASTLTSFRKDATWRPVTE